MKINQSSTWGVNISRTGRVRLIEQRYDAHQDRPDILRRIPSLRGKLT